MSETVKTSVFVVVALVLVALAVGIIPGVVPGAQSPEIFNDEGDLFFPTFTDPLAAKALDVIEYDAETASTKPFRVEVKDGRWTIPSHHGYPADAKDRMAEAAGILIGLHKDRISSDNPDDQKSFGVIDPTEESLETEGRGTLVRFQDEAGNDLAALIIGKEVENRSGFHYVRLPGKKRTYMAKLPVEVNTKFADWIETDLLKVGSWDIERLVFDNYKVNEATRRVEPGERVVAVKKDYEWSIEGLGEDEEPDKDALRDAATAVGNLKIVGVRAKPAGLTAQLAKAEGIQLDPLAMASLESRGFFFGGSTLFSNEGELGVGSKKGVVRTLRFGEILYGSGEDVTAGSDEEDASKGKGSGKDDESSADSSADSSEESGLQANRYLMVTARFDESLLEKPEGEPLADEHLEKRKTAREAIEKIVAAVNAYKEKNKKLPESLAILTEAPEGGSALLEKLDKDPWGNDYLYELQGEDEFVVRSHAEDGADGGEGVNGDIASNDWKHEDDLAKVAKDHKDYQTKVEEARKEVKQLMARFAPWYYVIDDENFKKLHLSRADVVKKKEAEQGEGDSTGPTQDEATGDLLENEGAAVPPVSPPADDKTDGKDVTKDGLPKNVTKDEPPKDGPPKDGKGGATGKSESGAGG